MDSLWALYGPDSGPERRALSPGYRARYQIKDHRNSARHQRIGHLGADMVNMVTGAPQG